MDINNKTLKLFSQDDYYIKNWDSLQKKESSFCGFNIFAMLFGMSWCFYRKMYLLGISCFFAGTVVSAGAVFIYMWLSCCDQSSVMEARYSIISIFSMFLLVRIPLGIFANKIYYKKAVTTINKINSTPSLSDDDRSYLLETEGGDSTGGAITSLIITFIINFLLF